MLTFIHRQVFNILLKVLPRSIFMDTVKISAFTVNYTHICSITIVFNSFTCIVEKLYFDESEKKKETQERYVTSLHT